MKNRLFTFLGFAIKAGKVIYGVDNIIAAKKPPFIVLVTTDLAENSKKKLEKYINNRKTECFTAALDELLPERKCKAIGITDLNLSNAVKSELKESRI